MTQKPAIGKQDFEKVRIGDYFYIDKTAFIKEWWESGDDVTLITRPRRFGKTLNMSMLECFFSIKYKNRPELFEGLSIWEAQTSDGTYTYKTLQGTYPVIALSFAGVKADNYTGAKFQMYEQIHRLWEQYTFLDWEKVFASTDAYIEKCRKNGNAPIIDEYELSILLNKLSYLLEQHYSQKVLIFLDEYDTPMQEAYVHGFWDEAVSLVRNLFNNTFKTNTSLERAMLTGITRISKESIFSDLNNLEVVTTTSEKYETYFGFTEHEVFAALDSHGLSDMKNDVKLWYDGFTFGKVTDIYNPWSIINFIDKKKLCTYWANTSTNGLIGKLIRESVPEVKADMEQLIERKTILANIDEQIVFNRLNGNINAIWSLLLASGYLKVIQYTLPLPGRKASYELALTNTEVQIMFEAMIADWFANRAIGYNEFIRALLADDCEEMNAYMNEIAMNSFSYFDSGKSISETKAAEQFYHGFVLGLMVELRDKYDIISNRESGFGRYDVMLAPLNPAFDGIIIEFKVKNKNNTLEETLNAALAQIESKNYDAELIKKGVLKDKIRHYGFAFEGKIVLIGRA